LKGIMRKHVWLLFAIWAAQAQTLEIGVVGGGGFLPGVPVAGAPSSVSAGFQSGPALGAVFTQNMYSRVSGEITYLYEQSNLRLSSGADSASFAGRAHVLEYEILYHLHPPSARVRPYFAVGGGMKIFQGTGAEAAYQVLMQYAYLTRTNELKPMLTFGGGVKIALRGRMAARLDLRDQLTTFPTKVISPAPGMAINSWLHGFVPTVGLEWALASPR
jgi:opacity protein-like surface antigen